MTIEREHHLNICREALDHIVEVPEHLRGGLKRYFEDGTEPGGFLLACVQNDLANALTRCTDPTRRDLDHVVSFLLNHAPHVAWGSRERRLVWQQRARHSLGGDDG